MLEFILSLLMLWYLCWLVQQLGSPKPLEVKTPEPLSTSATPGKSRRSTQAQRFFSTIKPTALKPASKPQFPNSKPVSGINREMRRAKQVPPDLPKKPPEKVIQPQPVQPVEQPIEPVRTTPSPQLQPEMSSDNARQEVIKQAAKRRKDFNRVASKTQYELYRLANGNVKVIDRLLIHARSRYPDRPEQWIWEKVIYDLERDRH